MSKLTVNASDIKIETFKIHGRGRWNEDGVRLIYLPTDKVFESTAHRSQHANRAQCFKNLERYLENLKSDQIIKKPDDDYVWIVLMKGPSWMYIKGVFNNSDAANLLRSQLEKEAAVSRFEIDQQSEFFVTKEKVQNG